MRSEDDAKRDFGHLFGILHSVVTEGVRDYYRGHLDVNHKHSLGSRRSLIRDYIVHRLKQEIPGIDGIFAFDKNQTTNFGIKNRFLARVHKLGKDLAGAVGHTQASLAFQRNEPTTLSLGEDFAEATCIRIGYVPNPNDPMEPRVLVTCPLGRQNAWSIELQRGHGAEIIPKPVSLPPDDIDDLVDVAPIPSRRSDEE